jgi:hypothetical protein
MNMDAIFKNGNVYVAIMHKDAREEIDFSDSMDLILCKNEGVTKNSLYGGRVSLELHKENPNSAYRYSNLCDIVIDGIKLKKLVTRDSGQVDSLSYFSLEQAAAYLNQIENLGVDSFLENYKLQLQGLKSELEGQADNLQQELALNYNDDKAKVLDSIKKVILSLVCIIFSLLVNMNAGLENHHYTEAYDNVISLYF